MTTFKISLPVSIATIKISAVLPALSIWITTIGFAHASPTIYTTRASFEAAITSGALYFESFETSFIAANPVVFGDVAISVVDRPANPWVRPSDIATYGIQSIDADPTVVFSFAHGVNAFGIDIIDFGTDYDYAELLFTGFGLDGEVITTADGTVPRYQSFFFGIIDPSNTWTTVTLTNTDLGDSMSFDGLVYGDVAAIPEPETYAMMLAGLGLLGVAARRRKLAKV